MVATSNDIEGPRLHGHIPALDGVRGLAILLVLAHHVSASMQFEFGWHGQLQEFLHLGWCGVDLFFVLSGFLITGILYDSKKSQHYWRDFYIRRALRIFPLYYLALAIVAILSVVWGQRELFGTASLAWPWVYLTNFVLWREGYGAFGVVDHFWSLAVEEHFYLVWPFVVLACSRTRLMMVAAAVICAAPMMRLILALNDTSAAALYTLTPMRADSLAIGGFIALAIRSQHGLTRMKPLIWPVLIAATLVMIAIIVGRGTVSHADRAMQTLGYSTFGIGFGALLLLVLTNRRVGGLLSIAAMRWFGKYSYGLYVWHPIVFTLAWHSDLARELRGGTTPIHVLVSLVLAFGLVWLITLASYHLWESKFLALKDRFSKGPGAHAAKLPIGSSVKARSL